MQTTTTKFMIAEMNAIFSNPSVARIPFKNHFSSKKLEEKYNNPRSFY